MALMLVFNDQKFRVVGLLVMLLGICGAFGAISTTLAFKDSVLLQLVFWGTNILSHILPPTVRVKSFEPAYNDKKAWYLNVRRGRPRVLRALLTICFVLSVFVMVAQSASVAALDWLKQSVFPPFPRA